ncbi:MAG: hypothetical protein R3C29_07765 [Dehalococcoidia bacterium]
MPAERYDAEAWGLTPTELAILGSSCVYMAIDFISPMGVYVLTQ